ncbi:MAG: hypothetical protein ABEK04_06260, partial [Candidatus Nanohalobium sp.]
MRSRKGVLTAVVAFLIASMLVSGLGIMMAVGTAQKAFSNIGQKNDRKWMKQYIIANMKAACEPDANRNINIPRSGSFQHTIEGLKGLKINPRNTAVGDRVVDLIMGYGSYTRKIKIESDGYLGSSACEG